MNIFKKILFCLSWGVVLVFVNGGVCYGALPHLPSQELWVKVVAMVVGILVILLLSFLGLYNILKGPVNLEAENSTRFSIISAVVLTFLWFLYVFGKIFNSLLMIALGVLLAIIVIIMFLREPKKESSSDNASSDNPDYWNNY